MTGEPKYATRRNPANPTFGARIAAVAAYLGGSLMPWQRQVADVALELDPNDPGAWRYPVVVVTVPRQAGGEPPGVQHCPKKISVGGVWV